VPLSQGLVPFEVPLLAGPNYAGYVSVHHAYTTEGWYGRVHWGTAKAKSAYLYVFVNYDER
jgi:hypothetical protein